MKLSIKFPKLDFLGGVVEFGTEEVLNIGNQEDWDDFGKDGKEEDLELCRKI